MSTLENELLRGLLRWSTGGPHWLAPLRRWLDAAAARIRPPANVAIEPSEAAGLRGEWFVPAEANTQRCLLYLGGGTPCNEPAVRRALVARIAAAAGVRVFRLDYRPASTHPLPAAMRDVAAAWRGLQQLGFAARDIGIAGDGFGAGVALAALVALRDLGEPLPRLAVLLSPCVDFTSGRGAIDPNGRRRRGIAPGRSREIERDARRQQAAHDRRPLVAPLSADLRGLPPLLIHVGGDEPRLADAQRLLERAHDAGVDARLRMWPDMGRLFHAFAPHLREANDAIASLGAYVRMWSSNEATRPLIRASFTPRMPGGIHHLTNQTARVA